MADVFREVDEEVRQDRIALALMRNWGWILLGALLIVAGVGAWRVYDYWRLQQAEASGGRYLDALSLVRDDKPADALAAFDGLAQTGTAGYAVLARFMAAGQRGANNPAEGAKAFDDLAADPKIESPMQDIARLRSALLLLDTTDLKAMQGRLAPMADANAPMRDAAREILALAAMKVNDTAAAKQYLDAIVADPIATALQRQRADALRGVVGAGATKP